MIVFVQRLMQLQSNNERCYADDTEYVDGTNYVDDFLFNQLFKLECVRE